MELIFQDDDILIINKPSGMLTIPDGYHKEFPCVKNEVENLFGRCWIVHRLDKETSGVLLIAKNESTHRQLNIAFENRLIKKCYHAMVIGNLIEQDFSIDLPLRINGDRKHRTIVDVELGRKALTNIVVLKNFSSCSFVAAHPFTGYTHQIRAHLAWSGYPILADSLYQTNASFQQNKLNQLINRVALHSQSISFDHPRTGKPVSFTASQPQDLSNLLNHFN